jgi:hypothetical protein
MTLMRNGSRPSIGKPAMCHARKERVLLIGTDQRITSGPAATTAAFKGRIHGCTRTLRKTSDSPLHRGRRPYMALSGHKPFRPYVRSWRKLTLAVGEKWSAVPVARLLEASRPSVGDWHPKRDTLPLSRPASPPPRPALRNRRAVEPLLGNLVAARQCRESDLRAPGVAVVPAPLRVASSGCLLFHGPYGCAGGG